jgi:hypothetical protein
VDASAARLDGARKTGEVAHGMELRLAGETKCEPRVERRPRHPPDQLHIVETRAMRRGEFLVEQLDLVAWRREQIAVEALERAVDLLVVHDRLDLIDGLRVAFRGEPRAILAVEALEVRVAIVERVHEVGGRARGGADAGEWWWCLSRSDLS